MVKLSTVRLSVAKAFVPELPETTETKRLGQRNDGNWQRKRLFRFYIVDCEDFDRVISSFLFKNEHLLGAGFSLLLFFK